MTKETENIHEAGTSITDRRICWIQTAHGDGRVKAGFTKGEGLFIVLYRLPSQCRLTKSTLFIILGLRLCIHISS